LYVNTHIPKHSMVAEGDTPYRKLDVIRKESKISSYTYSLKSYLMKYPASVRT
jgi:hypothetical protein